MPTSGLRNVLDSLRTSASLQEALGQTDGQLLQRYVAGRDEVAFEALVRRHGPMVLGVCRRLLSNPCDAEDAFQATFLVLARKGQSVLPRDKVANWLYGVAYRTAQKARAATARRQSRERQVRTLPEPATVADGLWHDLLPLLDQELSRLPDKYRLPLVLCDLEGQTRTKAAAYLSWPEGTVAGRLARGRALLARRLARHGLPLSGGVLTALLAQNPASACVPGALVARTGQAAVACAAGPAAAAGIVSAKVTLLTTGVLQAMLWNKLKVVMVVALLAAVALGSAGVLMHRAWAERPTEPGEAARAAEPPPQERGQGGDHKLDRVEDAAARELKALQGEWKVVGLESDGRKAPANELQGMRWIFKGAQVEGVGRGEKPAKMGEVKLDPAKNPRHFDLVGLEGDGKGKTLLGIYKLEKGQLTICMRDERASGKGRPTEFTADAGSDQGLITLESLKEPQKPAARPAPQPGQVEADVMRGKRWAGAPAVDLKVSRELVVGTTRVVLLQVSRITEFTDGTDRTAPRAVTSVRIVYLLEYLGDKSIEVVSQGTEVFAAGTTDPAVRGIKTTYIKGANYEGYRKSVAASRPEQASARLPAVKDAARAQVVEVTFEDVEVTARPVDVGLKVGLRKGEEDRRVLFRNVPLE